MAKAVGFSRTIKLQWLNKVVQLVNEGHDVEQIKVELDEYLSFELSDKTNIGKARNILVNTWAKEDNFPATLRDDALRLINKDSDSAIAIHWCMMLMAYPVFRDLCKLIGKISEFESQFSMKQIKQKLYDEWGETTTLMYSIEKLISTMRNVDALETVKPGVYRIKKHNVSNPEVINFLLLSMMTVGNSGYYTFADLKDSVYLFPFEYKISKEDIMMDKRFSMNTFGGELTVSLNA